MEREPQNTEIFGAEEILREYGEIFDKQTVVNVGDEINTEKEIPFYLENSDRSKDTSSRIVLTPHGIIILSVLESDPGNKEKVFHEIDEDVNILMYLDRIAQSFDGKDDKRAYNIMNIYFLDSHYFSEVLPYNHSGARKIVEMHLKRKTGKK